MGTPPPLPVKPSTSLEVTGRGSHDTFVDEVIEIPNWADPGVAEGRIAAGEQELTWFIPHSPGDFFEIHLCFVNCRQEYSFDCTLTVFKASGEAGDIQREQLRFAPNLGERELRMSVLCGGFSREHGYLGDSGSLKIQLRLVKAAQLVVPIIDAVPERKPVPYVGLLNQGATCYMNSLLQSLFHIPEFRSVMYTMDTTNPDKSDEENIPLNLQRLFGMLQLFGQACSTQDLTKSFGWGDLHTIVSHDVQEFCRVLLDNLETKMEGTDLAGKIPELFRGKSRSFIRCTNVDFESSREEVFYDISLIVQGNSSLEESFENYLETETLDGDNMYDAGELGKQEATMGSEFLEFPTVMHLHLRRVEYDPMSGRNIKINSRFTFPKILHIRPYLATGCEMTGDECDYELFGVLVHQGNPLAGHYWAYLRPENNDEWYMFNDAFVKAATEYEAIEGNFGGADPAFGETVERGYSAYMLVYVRRNAIGDIFRKIDDSEVPQAIVDHVDKEKEKERQNQAEMREKQQHVAAQFYREEVIDDNIQGSHMKVSSNGVSGTSFSFKRYDTVDTIYDKVAAILNYQKYAMILYQFQSSHLGEALLCNDMKFEELPSSSDLFYVHCLSESDTNVLSDSDTKLGVSLESRLLVFVLAYVPKLKRPLHRCFSALVDVDDAFLSLFGRFRAKLRLDEDIDLVVYVIEDVSCHLYDSEATFREARLVNGSFVAFEAAEPCDFVTPAAWDVDAEEEEDIDNEDEQRYITYREENNPLTVAEYMRDKYEVFEMSIGSICGKLNARIQFPRSLEIDSFKQFIGKLIDKDYSVCTHCLLLYGAKSKLPKDLSEFETVDRLRLEDGYIVACFRDVDELLLKDLCRLAISIGGGGLNCLFSGKHRVSEVIEDYRECWSVGEMPLRMVEVGHCGVERIYPGDAELGDAFDFAHVRIERVPEDQMDLTAEDRVVPVAYFQNGVVCEDVHLSNFLKLLPDERFSVTRERHNRALGVDESNGQAFVAFYLSDKRKEVADCLLTDESVLWDMVDQCSVIRVLLPAVKPNVYYQVAASIKLYN